MARATILIIASVLGSVTILSVVLYRGQSQTKFEIPNLVDHTQQEYDRPYHDTLVVDFIPPSNSKLGVAENTWKESSNLRRIQIQNMTKGNEPVKLIKILQYFPPTFSCPFTVEPIGNHPLGNWACGMEVLEKEEDCVIYIFGASSPRLDKIEPTFETELLNRTDTCRLYIYDVKEVKVEKPYQDRVEFTLVGGISKKKKNATNPIPTLSSLLKANGHGWVDILRIDLGNHTLSIMDKVVQDYEEVLPFGQLQIRLTINAGQKAFDNYIKWFHKLEDRGLRPFHAHAEQTQCNNGTLRIADSLTFEYSFFNMRGKHILLTTAT